jgi:hypothetical protein
LEDHNVYLEVYALNLKSGELKGNQNTKRRQTTTQKTILGQATKASTGKAREQESPQKGRKNKTNNSQEAAAGPQRRGRKPKN